MSFLIPVLKLDKVKTFEMWQPFEVGEFKITPSTNGPLGLPMLLLFLLKLMDSEFSILVTFAVMVVRVSLLERLTKGPSTPHNIPHNGGIDAG